jgi:hypothetical protein
MAHYEGRISSDKPRSVRWLSGAEVHSIDVLTAGSIEESPVNVRECSPSVEIGYVQIGGTPASHLVGLAGTPSTVPATRAAAWGDLEDPRYNYPWGWLLEDIDADQIDEVAAYYVRETWQYYFKEIPA